MKLSALDTWLDQYSHAPFNLGESGVQNGLVGEFLRFDTVEELRRMDFEHNEMRGSWELRQAVAAFHSGVDADRVLITAGVTEGILLYFHATFRPGANVVVVVPTFHSLYDVPKIIGFEIRNVSMRSEDGFALPLRSIERAIDDHTSAIVVCSPNNPTGATCTASDWGALIEIAEHRDCDVVADEQYRFLSCDKKTSIVPSAADLSPLVVAMASPGKCFGCVGLRVGWMVARPEIIERCLAFKTLTTHAVFKGSDLLARKVLEQHETLAERYRTWIASNLRVLDRIIQRHPRAIEYVRPQAGSVAFPRIKSWPTARAFAEELVTHSGVLVLPGDVFEMPEFFRIRLGVPPDYFEEAASRLVAILE